MAARAGDALRVVAARSTLRRPRIRAGTRHRHDVGRDRVRHGDGRRRAAPSQDGDVGAGKISGRSASDSAERRSSLPRTRGELAWFAGVALTAGICEELLYRGYFFAVAAPVSHRLRCGHCVGDRVRARARISRLAPHGARRSGRAVLGRLLFPDRLDILPDVSARADRRQRRPFRSTSYCVLMGN